MTLINKENKNLALREISASMSAFWCSWRPQISDSKETEEGRNIKVEEMMEMNKSHKAVFVCFFFIFGLMLNSFYQNSMLDIISDLCFCFRFQFGTARRANLAVNQSLNVERESCANTRLNGSIEASPTSQAKTWPSSHWICLMRICSCMVISRNIYPTSMLLDQHNDLQNQKKDRNLFDL